MDTSPDIKIGRLEAKIDADGISMRRPANLEDFEWAILARELLEALELGTKLLLVRSLILHETIRETSKDKEPGSVN